MLSLSQTLIEPGKVYSNCALAGEIQLLLHSAPPLLQMPVYISICKTNKLKMKGIDWYPTTDYTCKIRWYSIILDNIFLCPVLSNHGHKLQVLMRAAAIWAPCPHLLWPGHHIVCESAAVHGYPNTATIISVKTVILTASISHKITAISKKKLRFKIKIGMGL